MEVTFDLKTPDGKTAEMMAKIIQTRGEELRETTKKSCVALAINILRSLRADTNVAKDSSISITVTDVSSQFTPSFVRKNGAKGKKVSARCLRSGENGSVVNPKKVVWKTGKYRRGEKYGTFQIDEKVGNGKNIQYLIVCKNETKAQQFAKKFAKSRIRRFKGLAKHAVGIAMKTVYDKQNVPFTNITAEAKELASKVVFANVAESGFNSGEVSIIVEDKLDYAELALRNPPEVAVNNALAKMMGHIAHITKNKTIHDSMKQSIEELRQGTET